MSGNNQAIAVPGNGTVFYSAPGTALPANPLTAFTLKGSLPAGWSSFGHTSKQNIVNFSREGGETQTLDTFLEDAVRSIVTDSGTWTLNIAALQIEAGTLDNAFNGQVDDVLGRYVIPASPQPVEKQLFVLLTDNSGNLGFEIPRADLTASGAFSLDPSNYVEIPIAATLLSDSESQLGTVNGGAGIMAVWKETLKAPVTP